MKRYSYQDHRSQLVAILIFVALSVLLLVSYPSLMTAQKIAQSRRPETKEEKIVRATLQLINRCPQPHYFRISSDIKDPRFKQQTDALLVDASSTKKIEVVFDAIGSNSNPKAMVECLDCKKEEGCAQDRYELPIAISPGDTASRGGTPVSTRFSSGLSTQSGAHDVGIIPDTSGACPVGSEHVIISMDDQDDIFLGSHNNSSVQGWTGEISRYSTGTTFGFCRVDGNQFQPFFYDYAVLQLGSSCPTGSATVKRFFDNENNQPHNWSSGNIGLNGNNGATPLDWELYFCVFPGTSSIHSTLPSFYVSYGVFAAPSSQWLAQGKVHTDDEDDNPQIDDTNPKNTTEAFRFGNVIYGPDYPPFGGRNTELLVAKVANAMACTNPCPSIGSYDGYNCQVGQPPPGTTAFIWSTNFYYTPVNGAQTAAQKCPKPGSWFDGANCFMKAIPPQTHPFIWANWWYVEPVCRP